MEPYQILIVEDEFVFACDLEQRLAGLGYAVMDKVCTGAAALAAASQRTPDLVLMDIHLPGDMDGIEAAIQIHRQHQAPVVFLTAFGEETTVERAKAAEPYGYILKPVEDRELKIVIEMSLAKHEAEKRLRESEIRYRSLFERAGDYVLLLEPRLDGPPVIADANEAALRAHGYTREELVGQPITLLDPDFSTEEHRERLRLLEGAGAPLFTTRHRRKNGQYFEVEVRASPVLLGTKRYYLSVERDITERKRLEACLLEARKMEGIGRLAGGVAHEFNNILAAVMLNVNLLEDSATGFEQRDSLREVAELATQGANIVRQLLAFSRQSAMNARPLDLARQLAGFSKVIRRVASERVAVEVAPGGPVPRVKADAGMLEQALLNLCLNACEAMPGGGRLQLELRAATLDAGAARRHPDARPGQFVCLSVADTGRGMDDAVLSRLFEPFFTTKEVGQGPGLGLATVHGIVHQHRGWVEVSSTPGQGSTFRLFLPALAEAEAEAAVQKAPEPAPMPRGRETILLVEDESALRLVTSKFLQHLGYRVLEAENSAAAHRLWQQHWAEIALLFVAQGLRDGHSGGDLAARLRADRPELKAIISSGFTTEVFRVPNAGGPTTIQLPIPFPPEDLAALLRACLDEPSAADTPPPAGAQTETPGQAPPPL